MLQGPDVPSRIVDAAVKAAQGESGAPALASSLSKDGSVKEEEGDIASIDTADYPKGPFLEDDVNSGIHPYNAYRHPFSHLKRFTDADPTLFPTYLQRLIIPTIMPAGLDAHQIINERERFIDARIHQRIRELEAMPSTMGDGSFDTNIDVMQEEKSKEDKENESTVGAPLSSSGFYSSLVHPSETAHGKLRALIELGSLRVLDKQRAMRAQVAEKLTRGSMLPLNRLEFRRTRKPTSSAQATRSRSPADDNGMSDSVYIYAFLTCSSQARKFLAQKSNGAEDSQRTRDPGQVHQRH